MSKWLVEIRVKDWIHTKCEADRILGYVEVEIDPYYGDQFSARHKGFDQFVHQVTYQPSVRKTVEAICGPLNDPRRYGNLFCAPDAVLLD